MSARTTIECDWCGREDWVDSITDDNGDTFHWCSRHEAQVMSMIVELPPERDYEAEIETGDER